MSNHYNMDTERKLMRAYKLAVDERTEWRFKIQSALLMVSSTTFAVIVSLSNPSNYSFCSKILLLVTIGTNALCILSCGISIYENLITSNRVICIVREYTKKYLHEELPSGRKSLFSNIPRKRICTICEKLSYISFLLFIISLTSYAISRIFA